MTSTTALRLAVIGLAAAALGGCMPIMFDRDGNWRGQQPVGPAYGSATQASETTGTPILEPADVTEEPTAEDPAAGAAAPEAPAAD